MSMGVPRRGRASWVSWILVPLLLFLATPARAEPSGVPRADVVLLLDRSGSMKQNDPKGIALAGAQLFLGMLAPEDRVSVVAFDTGARTILPLSPVGDGTAGRNAINSLGNPTGQWTDLKGGLIGALSQLDGQATPERQPGVVLFTDGKPQTQADGVPPGYMEELSSVVMKLAGRSIPVFSVGLGQADYRLLESIASGTRAESFAATAPAQAVKLFSDVLSRIKERQMVLSFEDDLTPGATGQVKTFQVPPYTRLLTLNVVGGSDKVGLKGQTPSGTPLAEAPGVQVTTGSNYVVYTIPNPAPGLWHAQMEGAGKLWGQGQTESLLRLNLQSPKPFSQVDISRAVPVTVTLAGDPDPGAALEVWAQGSESPVKLEQQGHIFSGKVPLSGGHLVAWVARAGNELTRREFRFYPTGSLAPGQARAATGAVQSNLWRYLVIAGIAAAGCAALLLGVGAWNWKRLRLKEERVGGRLGSLALKGTEIWIGSDLTILREPRNLAVTLSAKLVPRGWAPLAGLGLVGRQRHLFIRPGPGIRLQINGAPPADGRLYHGDIVTIGADVYTFTNPELPRRPVKGHLRSRPRPSGHTFQG